MDNQNPAANNGQSPDRFESDTERIIHRHLSNKDDVITDDDIRNVRIGVTPTPQQIQDKQEQFENEVESAAQSTNEEEPDQTGEPTTPWDLPRP